MKKRKQFGISADLSRGFSETISAVENNTGETRYTIVSLDRIERDPENPRELAITEADFSPKSIQANDPDCKRKKAELLELEELASTIKEQGVLQPIILYHYSDKYRIIAGERRFLASLLAGKTEIQAKIYDKKPSSYDIRVLQWVENNARKNLSLKDTLKNIQQIVDEYQKENPQLPVNAATLAKLIGKSETMARRYLSILNAGSEVRQAINEGSLLDSRAAEMISAVKSNKDRQALLNSVKGNDGLKEVRGHIAALKANNHAAAPVKTKQDSRGRAQTRINLGASKNPFVVKTLIESVLENKQFTDLKSTYVNVNWNDLKSVNSAFKELINTLEKRLS